MDNTESVRHSRQTLQAVKQELKNDVELGNVGQKKRIEQVLGVVISLQNTLIAIE